MKQLKAGLFGLWRGRSDIMAMEVLGHVEVTAICDQSPSKEEEVKHCPGNLLIRGNFDELLNSGIDLMVLCNYPPIAGYLLTYVRCVRKYVTEILEGKSTSIWAFTGPALRACRCTGLARRFKHSKQYYSSDF